MPFCTDTDLLHFEPNLMRDAGAASQTILAGTCTLAGTTLTISTGSLIDSHVQPQQVVVLTSGVSGIFPIISIDSATTLTLSILYNDLFVPGTSPLAISPGNGSGMTYSIRTFWPQRDTISNALLQAAGVTDASGILNPEVLVQPCALGALQMIYTAIAAAAADPAAMLQRADLYERLYRRALRSTRLQIDSNGDGVVDSLRPLSVLEFRRG